MPNNLPKYLLGMFFVCFLSFPLAAADSSSGLSFYVIHYPDGDTLSSIYAWPGRLPFTYDDMHKLPTFPLFTPSNLHAYAEYDPLRNVYVVYVRLGSEWLSVPLLLSPQEYTQWRDRHFIRQWRRNQATDTTQVYRKGITFLKQKQKKEPLFGTGSFYLKAKGRASVSLGFRQNRTGNPSLPQQARSRNTFYMDEDIRLDLQAGVGTKLRFDMEYNSNAMYDHDARRMSLSYTGNEDEIIRHIEAGQVKMTTNNSLIQSGTDLFGVKADLQFGRLRINSILAQQETQSRKINTRGSVQTHEFELPAYQYDPNRHFFLAHYFYETFDELHRQLPYVPSALQITKIEVWLTHRGGQYDNTRHIIAFSDLGENKQISHAGITGGASDQELPDNGANDLYARLQTDYTGCRDIHTARQVLGAGWIPVREYEKLESARLLDPSEYFIHEKAGYLSLHQPIKPDDILAVSFEYTYKGSIYKVGEFSTDDPANSTQAVYTKLIKGSDLVPDMPYWRLMMKNIYALQVQDVQKEQFRMDVLFRNDTTGIYSYTLAGDHSETLLSRMGLDRSDSYGNARPDGVFDYIEGYTIRPDKGLIVFPAVEPFGRGLKENGRGVTTSEMFLFTELYDSLQWKAQQMTGKHQYVLRGAYRASQNREINLGISPVPAGSVRIIAGGVTLTEHIDYQVDYLLGTVSLLNDHLSQGNTALEISVDGQSVFARQRKTMAGMELNYEINPFLMVGATVMHLAERSTASHILYGEEGVKNTLWGAHLHYRKEGTQIRDLLNRVPWLNYTRQSHVAFTGEFAYLKAGQNKSRESDPYVYLDDFESAVSHIPLGNPHQWFLASTPWHDSDPLFPEAGLINDLSYSNNRSLLSWYILDGMFTRKGSSRMPGYLKRDKDQLSDHRVRAVNYQELFPQMELEANATRQIRTLDLAYYPRQRGPYNLDVGRVSADGMLMNPEKRWGGMMRKMEVTNFETANVESIEFWLMDPFLQSSNQQTGGDLYINLGEISEDILKDGRKFYENGLPMDGDLTKVEKTVWGYVPVTSSNGYVFENSEAARKKQDVGLNGLSTEEEKYFDTYRQYLEKLQQVVEPATWVAWQDDPFSPVNDPAGDNYHHFRMADYDRLELPVLERYKRVNGTEGNSSGTDDLQSAIYPDTEDINQDNTLNEQERYYEYRLSIRPSDLVVGKNYITDRKESLVLLENGTQEAVVWYRFKVPIRKYSRRISNPQGFDNIRFMRMYLTDFRENTVLRLANFQLARGEWRIYDESLSEQTMDDPEMELSAVNIIESSDRTPVNYILPPGVERSTDPYQTQLIHENEQSLSVKISGLQRQDSRAVYKQTHFDLRKYKHLEMFIHGEGLPDDPGSLLSGDVSVFFRMGTDQTKNYYEYELPLTITPPGRYSSMIMPDREVVWPSENKIELALNYFTELKLKRNRLLNSGEPVSLLEPFTDEHPVKEGHRLRICGNPSLADMQLLLVGIKNNTGEVKQVEIWINELRLLDTEPDNGWAAHAALDVNLSDLGSFRVDGQYETARFGALDQSIHERRMEDYKRFSFSTALDLGKLFPEKTGLTIPFYYSYFKEVSTPEYNPFDTDILLNRSLTEVSGRDEKEQLSARSNTRNVLKSISFQQVRLNRRNRMLMPYDPANFTISYSYNQSQANAPTLLYDTEKEYRGNLTYSYQPEVKTYLPFRKRDEDGYLKRFTIYYLPSDLTFSTDIYRRYTERKLSDTYREELILAIPVSFSQQFTWNRAFTLRWRLIHSLIASFQSGTKARIEEPYMQVNKKLDPDRYKVWRDSVRRSIRHLGTPLAYDQQFTVTYSAPFNTIRLLNWLQAEAHYRALYNWEKVIAVHDSLSVGNRISNQRTIRLQGYFNFLLLYNKFPVLRDIQRRANTNSTGRESTIKDHLLRFLLLVRRMSLSYEWVDEMILPGFRPQAGDLLGQKRVNGRMVPGLSFAFGSVHKGFIEEAKRKDWLIWNEQGLDPAVIRRTRNVSGQMNLEPITGLRIDLSADWLHSGKESIDYMYPDLTPRQNGSFTMSIVGFRQIGSKKNFDRFLTNRDRIAARKANAQHNNNPEYLNSMGVLIPAFFSAYASYRDSDTRLSWKPPLRTVLPNWQVSWDGLQRIPFLRRFCKTILLTHQYKGVYSVPSYSFTSGYTGTNGNRLYIPTLSIQSGLTPLGGLQVVFVNELSVRFQYSVISSYTLHTTSLRLTETTNHDYQIAMGYKRILRNKSPKETFTRELVSSLTLDFRNSSTLLRKITENETSATQGNRSCLVRFQSDYRMNRFLLVGLFFELDKNKPFMVTTTYPAAQTTGGVKLVFLLDYEY